jgi:ankyrin repeat protein
VSVTYLVGNDYERSQDGRTALHWAASSNSLDIIRFLLDKKADVDKLDSSGWSALHIAGRCLYSSSHIMF